MLTSVHRTEQKGGQPLEALLRPHLLGSSPTLSPSPQQTLAPFPFPIRPPLPLPVPLLGPYSSPSLLHLIGFFTSDLPDPSAEGAGKEPRIRDFLGFLASPKVMASSAQLRLMSDLKAIHNEPPEVGSV